MRRISVLTLFLVASIGFAAQSNVRTTRIVGGTAAAPNEVPFIVSLQSEYYGHFCGGSLIAPGWVLTAAHCVSGTFKVTTGLNSTAPKLTSETFAVKKVIKHPSYSKPMSYAHDFALLQLEGESHAPTIMLNSDMIAIQEEEANAQISTTAGWGALNEGGGVATTLMKVDVPLVSFTNCNKAYTGKIHDSMICAGFKAGGKDSCQGDSGGPLYYNNPAGQQVLIGVVSWGRGCARPNYYGVYSKVDFVKDWIAETIKANSPVVEEQPPVVEEKPEDNGGQTVGFIDVGANI